MTIGKKIAAFCAITVLSAVVFAETIAVTVIQNEKVPERALEYTRNLENAVMDALYFDGHIVSNDVIRSDSNAFKNKQFGIETARNGRAGYLIDIYAEYSKDIKEGSTTEEPDLQKVSYRIVNIHKNKIHKDVVIKTSKLKETDAEKITALIAERIEKDIIRQIADDKGSKE